jgi:hypothetical protein
MIQDTTSILETIHSQVFLKSADYTINIFLCGASVSDPNSIRTLIYESLRGLGKTNVVLPEWLFSDLVAKPEYNLLKLENELATNVDLVIIPLEGVGTIAELGAFASFETIRSKIIVINDTAHKRKQSFVNVGPIKLIRQEHPDNVMYYDTTSKDDLINKVVTRIKYLKNREPKSEVNNLFNLSRFILFIIGIYQPVTKTDLRDMILRWRNQITDYYIEPCLTILIKNGIVLSSIRNHTDLFSLTEKGHIYVFEKILPSLRITKEFNKIRTQVIYAKHRYRRKPDLIQERERLLVVS